MITAFLKRHWWWLLPLLIFDIYLVCRLWHLARNRAPGEASVKSHIETVEPDVPSGLIYTYPTDQRNLHDTESLEVYQPTASGRVESALYGSVRTVQRGGRLLASFHAGLDIAPLRLDRRGRPLDEVRAVTDGKIAYINRVAGNSNYGIYVVLVHPDPLGDIYTLYAHLARIKTGLKNGATVSRGDVLGIMGNTASTGIPMHRAHLHLEIGLIKNMRFHSWHRKQKLVPDHGTYHGYNLTAINPLAVYGEGGDEIFFSMFDHLRHNPPAFELVFRHARQLDYFKRYPDLWEGAPYPGTAMTVSVSEGGALLTGRTATPEEIGMLNDDSAHVLRVDEDVLGRNGRRLITQRGGNWELGRTGRRWLDILCY